MTRRERDADGHFYPALRARIKILLRCKVCGWDLRQREVWEAKSGPLRHDLVHRKNGRRCGPVAYEQQR